MRGAFGGIAHVPPAAGRAPFHRQILARSRQLDVVARQTASRPPAGLGTVGSGNRPDTPCVAVRDGLCSSGRGLSPIAEWPA